MGIRQFFSSDSAMKKAVQADALSANAAVLPDTAFSRKSKVVSIVEHHFKRMNEAHDRIRTQLLSQSHNSR